MVIGFGRVVGTLHIRGVPIQFRMYPLSGFALPAPRNLNAPRLKMALIYLAGPGAEAVHECCVDGTERTEGSRQVGDRACRGIH